MSGWGNRVFPEAEWNCRFTPKGLQIKAWGRGVAAHPRIPALFRLFPNTSPESPLPPLGDQTPEIRVCCGGRGGCHGAFGA